MEIKSDVQLLPMPDEQPRSATKRCAQNYSFDDGVIQLDELAMNGRRLAKCGRASSKAKRRKLGHGFPAKILIWREAGNFAPR